MDRHHVVWMGTLFSSTKIGSSASSHASASLLAIHIYICSLSIHATYI